MNLVSGQTQKTFQYNLLCGWANLPPPTTHLCEYLAEPHVYVFFERLCCHQEHLQIPLQALAGVGLFSYVFCY